jgi:hypothetical protein
MKYAFVKCVYIFSFHPRKSGGCYGLFPVTLVVSPEGVRVYLPVILSRKSGGCSVHVPFNECNESICM